MILTSQLTKLLILLYLDNYLVKKVVVDGQTNLLKTSLKAARSESAIDIGSVSVESVSPSAAAEAVREAASVSRSAETYL